MFYGFALLFICLLAGPAHASNLNTTSNLVDAGIYPPAVTVTTLPNGVPLMDGLQLYQEPHFIEIFPENTSNSIVAVGVVDVDDTYNFYKRELPPLGWKATGSRDYTQGATSLHIDARAEGKESIVTFTTKVSP